MNKGEYNQITKQCKTIIQNNNPEKSIQKISNLTYHNGTKLNKENALKIYKVYSTESISYDPDKNKNNIRKIHKTITDNIYSASYSCKK